MKSSKSLEQIRDLFQDEGLRARVMAARTKEEALGVIVTAGAESNVDFSADSLQRLIEIHGTPPPEVMPSLADLVDVSGSGLRMAEGTHVHMSCCTECPTGEGLCK